MTGLEYLQRLLASGERPGIAISLDFSLAAVSYGFAAFEGNPGDHAYNPFGSVHGGYTASLLDSACGCAVHSRLSAGDRYTTLELKVAYHKTITKETGRVRAEGFVVSMGRRVAFSEAKLVDRAGTLLASATSTLLVIARHRGK